MFVYDASSGDRICELGSPAHKGGIYGLDFSPSGARLISVSADKKIKLWSAEKPYDLLCEYAFEDKLDNMQVRSIYNSATSSWGSIRHVLLLPFSWAVSGL